MRFRAAIKEPEELPYLFLAIGIGLGMGAGQPVVTTVALALILAVVAIRYYLRPRSESPNLYVILSAPVAAGLTPGTMLEVLQAAGTTASLRHYEESPERVEAALQVHFQQVGALEKAAQRLRELCAGMRISCLEERGLDV